MHNNFCKILHLEGMLLTQFFLPQAHRDSLVTRSMNWLSSGLPLRHVVQELIY